MGLQVQQHKKNRTWSRIILEESDQALRLRGEKRKRTFRRMYMTVFVMFGSVALLYSSLFYVGSFIDPGKIIGISRVERAQNAQRKAPYMQTSAPRTLLSPVLDSFALNRVYLRKGQAIQATYSIPQGTYIHLKIRQCHSRPIFEIFDCQFIAEQKTTINNKTQGSIRYQVLESGFYYFEDKVIKGASTKLKRNVDYRVVWQRA